MGMWKFSSSTQLGQLFMWPYNFRIFKPVNFKGTYFLHHFLCLKINLLFTISSITFFYLTETLCIDRVYSKIICIFSRLMQSIEQCDAPFYTIPKTQSQTWPEKETIMLVLKIFFSNFCSWKELKMTAQIMKIHWNIFKINYFLFHITNQRHPTSSIKEHQ